VAAAKDVVVQHSADAKEDVQQPAAVDGASALGTAGCPSLDAQQSSGGAKLAESGGSKLAESASAFGAAAGALGATLVVDGTGLACWVNPAAVHVFVSKPMTSKPSKP
jgi:hypothetical protein